MGGSTDITTMCGVQMYYVCYAAVQVLHSEYNYIYMYETWVVYNAGSSCPLTTLDKLHETWATSLFPLVWACWAVYT